MAIIIMSTLILIALEWKELAFSEVTKITILRIFFCLVHREADVAIFEAGDIYSAGLNYELVPFMGEQYNLDTLEYYVVAVSKEDDPDTDVLYLKSMTMFT